MNKKKQWLANLRVHYIWTFFSSFVFLSPVLSLYYLHYNLDISDIIFLTAMYKIFLSILEIPTSTIGDTWSKSKTLFLSAVFSLVSAILYLVFPVYSVFVIAVFFSALAQALWSWTGHAKLEEDLKAAGMQDDFQKILWRLIALLRAGTLLTPVCIFAILKYFENWYQILAWVDVIIWIIVLFFVSRFRDIETSGYKIFQKSIKKNIILQWETLADSFIYLKNNKRLLLFLFLILLWTDGGLLAITYLPIIVDINSIEDYFGSIYTLWVSIASIAWWILAYKISKKLWNMHAIWILFILLGVSHIMTFFFHLNTIVLTWIIMISTFVSVVVFTIWNGALANFTQINNKSTVRSIFLSIVGLYSYCILFILSKVDLEIAFLIIGIIIIFSWALCFIFARRLEINGK